MFFFKIKLSTHILKKQSLALWNMGYLIGNDKRIVVRGNDTVVKHFIKNKDNKFDFMKSRDNND